MKILKRIVLVLGAFGIICAGFLIAGLFRYTRGVPRITPKNDLTFSAGTVINLHDIADIEKYDTAGICDAYWDDGSVDGLVIINKGSSIRTGSRKGELNLIVDARGYSEARLETIKVKMV